VQHKSQPSLLINARLRHPILIGNRGFVQKPEGLTTFGRLICLLTKSFGYKYLSLASDGQFSPAESGQGQWLFHQHDITYCQPSKSAPRVLVKEGDTLM
jgi:hypothetical protein